MKAFRRHWYSLGLIPAAVMAAWLAWNWVGIVWVQKLLALNFIVLILHQFEEYAWARRLSLDLQRSIDAEIGRSA